MTVFSFFITEYLIELLDRKWKHPQAPPWVELFDILSPVKLLKFFMTVNLGKIDLAATWSSCVKAKVSCNPCPEAFLFSRTILFPTRKSSSVFHKAVTLTFQSTRKWNIFYMSNTLSTGNLLSFFPSFNFIISAELFSHKIS